MKLPGHKPESPPPIFVIATVRSARPFDQAVVDHLAKALNGRLDEPTTLEVVVLPAIRSAPSPAP